MQNSNSSKIISSFIVSNPLADNYLRKTLVKTKLSNLSELANILSVKSSVGANLLSLFNRFGSGVFYVLSPSMIVMTFLIRVRTATT